MELVIDRDKVDERMEELGISSYIQLAEEAGLHKNTLVKVLKGERWRSDTLAGLVKALKCNPFDLIRTEENPDSKPDALAVHTHHTVTSS